MTKSAACIAVLVPGAFGARAHALFEKRGVHVAVWSGWRSSVLWSANTWARPAAREGYLILQTEGTFEISGVFAGILGFTVFALAPDGIVSLAERRLLLWRPRSGETEKT